MNIFDYAMQIEKEGDALYTEFARTAPNKGMTTIFTELAEQEKKHYEIFKKMKERQDVSIAGTSSLSNSKGVFAKWKEEKNKFDFNISQADLYRKALEIEQKSIDFYMDKSREADNIKQKKIFEGIADEERAHYDVVENVIEFITKPERWVENAEFGKMREEY
ncbi:MAG: ferritin family protein [Candidatus Omnitrophota bacterium]